MARGLHIAVVAAKKALVEMPQQLLAEWQVPTVPKMPPGSHVPRMPHVRVQVPQVPPAPPEPSESQEPLAPTGQ